MSRHFLKRWRQETAEKEDNDHVTNAGTTPTSPTSVAAPVLLCNAEYSPITRNTFTPSYIPYGMANANGGMTSLPSTIPSYSYTSNIAEGVRCGVVMDTSNTPHSNQIATSPKLDQALDLRVSQRSITELTPPPSPLHNVKPQNISRSALPLPVSPATIATLARLLVGAPLYMQPKVVAPMQPSPAPQVPASPPHTDAPAHAKSRKRKAAGVKDNGPSKQRVKIEPIAQTNSPLASVTHDNNNDINMHNNNTTSGEDTMSSSCGNNNNNNPSTRNNNLPSSVDTGCSQVNERKPDLTEHDDIDPSMNLVHRSAEVAAELAAIDNRIGEFRCALCRILFPDAFDLAEHCCSGIRSIRFPCPECPKVFKYAAHLASHRRWHKPRGGGAKVKQATPLTPPSMNNHSAIVHTLPPVACS